MVNLENTTQGPPISDKSIICIHKIVFKWLGLGLIIFYAGHYFNIDQQACSACFYLSKKLWFVEDMAITSSFTNGTRLQWLFLVLTYPVIMMLILFKVDDVKHGDMKIQLPIFMTVVAMFPVIGILIEKDKSEAHHGYYGLFLHSMFFAPVMSSLIFYVLLLSTIFVGLYIKAYIQSIGGRGG